MPTARLVVRLLAISLPLYFAWEMLQMPAFTGTPPGWLVNTLMCVLATLLDAALVLGLYGVGVGVFRDSLWFRPPRLGRYLLVVLLAIAVNSVWEWVTVGWMGLWGHGAVTFCILSSNTWNLEGVPIADVTSWATMATLHHVLCGGANGVGVEHCRIKLPGGTRWLRGGHTR